jgi:hypothetical protein
VANRRDRTSRINLDIPEKTRVDEFVRVLNEKLRRISDELAAMSPGGGGSTGGGGSSGGSGGSSGGGSGSSGGVFGPTVILISADYQVVNLPVEAAPAILILNVLMDGAGHPIQFGTAFPDANALDYSTVAGALNVQAFYSDSGASWRVLTPVQVK